MKTTAAVLYEVNKPLVVEQLDIDEPRSGEVRVKIASAGVCHSDFLWCVLNVYMMYPKGFAYVFYALLGQLLVFVVCPPCYVPFSCFTGTTTHQKPNIRGD